MTNAVAIYNSFDDIQRAAIALEASGYFSDVKSKAQAITKVMAGAELGIPPFASMSGIHIIHGKPELGANVMATLIKNDPRYNYRVVKLDDVVCKIQFYEDGQTCGISEFTIEDAQRAGTKNLQKFPRNMLFARAISNGAKWYAPGIFGGVPVYVQGELSGDGEGDIIDVTPEPAAIDTKRELESLAVVVDHEPEHEEDIGEPDDNGNEAKPQSESVIADLRATIEGGTDGKVTLGFVCNRATMTGLYKNTGENDMSRHAFKAALLWGEWPDDNGKFKKDSLSNGSIMPADKGLALFDWLVARKETE